MNDEVSIASLIARVKRLEEALDPFCAVASWYEWRKPDSVVLSSGNGDVLVADLLEARAARRDKANPLARKPN